MVAVEFGWIGGGWQRQLVDDRFGEFSGEACYSGESAFGGGSFIEVDRFIQCRERLARGNGISWYVVMDKVELCVLDGSFVEVQSG